MKIAIFVDSFYPVLGGMEDATALLAKSLGEAGQQVDLYIPYFNRRNYLGRHLPIGDLDLGPNVHFYHLFSLPLPYWLFAARLVIPTLSGYRLLRRNRPDLIHVQSIWGAGLEALLASRLLNIPLVGTNHSIISAFGDYLPFARQFLTRALVRYDAWFYNHCHLVSAPSLSALKALEGSGLIVPRRVISNIIERDIFSTLTDCGEKEKIKDEFGFGGHCPLIAFAGRFAIEKRVEIILQAVNLVQRDLPEVLLALAGSGVQQRNWEKLIARLGIEQNVKFVGRLGKEQLAKLFQIANVFAIASPVESQGMVALQAMSTGLPVVGVNGQAIPEYVNHENGYIVPVDDYRAMAECLLKLLKDPLTAQALGRKGREKVEPYAKESIIHQWTEVYRSVIKQQV